MHLVAASLLLVPLQKYTIRDLTTGQLFVVDAQPGSQGAEALSEPGSPAKEGGFRILGHLKGALKPPVSSKDA